MLDNRLLQGVPTTVLVLFLVCVPGCSSTNLGQLDEARSERDDMRGPGIFADEKGETILKWSNDGSRTANTEEKKAASAIGDRAEFEQFKKWDQLRTLGKDSAEYQEFLQWLEYQEFKAGQ